MAKHKKMTISVDGTEIRYYKEKKDDFISITDIAKKFNERSGQIILNWLRTRSTISFLGAWETIHNNSFNVLTFEDIRNRAGDPTFTLSISDWVSQTEAIGIRSKTGRYGGTFAHKDIAFEFLSYLSPTFKLYVFKEFQRLKSIETVENRQNIEWNLHRLLSKINYKVHTDAIKDELIPPRLSKKNGFIYANEADILNVAVFGYTSKIWRLSNEDKKGNIRDFASPEQLLILANLESLNAEFIRMKISQDERVDLLNKAAINQMKSLLSSPSLSKIGNDQMLLE